MNSQPALDETTKGIANRLQAGAEFKYYRFDHPSMNICKEPLPSKLDDVAEFEKAFRTDPSRQEHVKCPIGEEELATLRTIFTTWTGLDVLIENEDGSQTVAFDEEAMFYELGEVRNFFKNDLGTVFGLHGVMAEINQTMFMQDLEPYSEEELMGYVNLFHIDVDYLEEFQTQLLSAFDEAPIAKGRPLTDAELEELETLNEERFLTELRMVILDFRIKMVDRFRLLRWRENVLFSKNGHEYDEFPGVSVHNRFESAAELIKNGIDYYYVRVGEARRESLTRFFNYLELYHLAGLLSQGVAKEVKFDSQMTFERLADLVILMIDDMQLNPRHLLTPLGIRVIRNLEDTENDYNMHRLIPLNSEKLTLAASQAGIKLLRDTEIIDSDGVQAIRTEQKPAFVIKEELAFEMVSPQFFSSVEKHRDWKSNTTSIKSISDAWLLSAKEGEILFYGVGDGLSMYRVYAVTELIEVFTTSRNFIDPYSINENPDNTSLWTVFAENSIRRLLIVVIPQLKKKTRTFTSDPAKLKMAADIELLENIIVEVFDHLELNGNDNPILLTGEDRQDSIMADLRKNMKLVRSQLSQFLAFLFNLGSQLSDWEDIIDITEKAHQVAILQNPGYRSVDPETTENLTTKLYRMLGTDVEHYLQLLNLNDDPTMDFSRHVSSLRLAKHYQGAYRFDWDDDRMTIAGQLYRMIKYADLGFYPELQTCGNWLMATSQYYSIELLDDAPEQSQMTLDF